MKVQVHTRCSSDQARHHPCRGRNHKEFSHCWRLRRTKWGLQLRSAEYPLLMYHQAAPRKQLTVCKTPSSVNTTPDWSQSLFREITFHKTPFSMWIRLDRPTQEMVDKFRLGNWKNYKKHEWQVEINKISWLYEKMSHFVIAREPARSHPSHLIDRLNIPDVRYNVQSLWWRSGIPNLWTCCRSRDRMLIVTCPAARYCL